MSDLEGLVAGENRRGFDFDRSCREGGPMRSFIECRRKAHDCRRLADQVTDPQLRRILADLAEQWAGLAADCEAAAMRLGRRPAVAEDSARREAHQED
jgi:hypothetical protein